MEAGFAGLGWDTKACLIEEHDSFESEKDKKALLEENRVLKRRTEELVGAMNAVGKSNAKTVVALNTELA